MSNAAGLSDFLRLLDDNTKGDTNMTLHPLPRSKASNALHDVSRDSQSAAQSCAKAAQHLDQLEAQQTAQARRLDRMEATLEELRLAL